MKINSPPCIVTRARVGIGGCYSNSIQKYSFHRSNVYKTRTERFQRRSSHIHSFEFLNIVSPSCSPPLFLFFWLGFNLHPLIIFPNLSFSRAGYNLSSSSSYIWFLNLAISKCFVGRSGRKCGGQDTVN